MPGRLPVSLQILVFLIAFNAVSGLVTATDTGDVFGADPSPSGSPAIQQATSDSYNQSVSGGSCQSLACQNQGLWSQLLDLHDAILPGFALLVDAGFPRYMVTFVEAFIGIMLSWDTISFLRSG